MKTAIVYYSKHHGNTKQLLDAIAAKYEVTLIDAAETPDAGLEAYDLIGFASGIYFSKFHKSVVRFAEKYLPAGKKVFFLYTCGSKKESYTARMEALAAEKSAEVLGAYGCRGFDTYGPFKLVGGIAKGHPNRTELENAVRFYESLL